MEFQSPAIANTCSLGVILQSQNLLAMNEKLTTTTSSIGLFIGGIFGLVGSFAPSASLRGLAWGVDGVGLVLASALLTIYYFRKGLDITAAGFLIFAVGEGLILSSSGIDLDRNVPAFGAGTSLWAASLFLISFQKTYPLFIRCSGLLAAVLFSVVAVQIFTDHPVNALTKPLPFFAYPIFVITIFGWAWTLLRTPSLLQNAKS
jgi:hypothetical protein